MKSSQTSVDEKTCHKFGLSYISKSLGMFSSHATAGLEA